MKDIQRGIVGGNPAPTTTQQAGRRDSPLEIQHPRCFSVANVPHPTGASAPPPYPQSQQPSAPSTGGPPPTTTPGRKPLERGEPFS